MTLPTSETWTESYSSQSGSAVAVSSSSLMMPHGRYYHCHFVFNNLQFIMLSGIALLCDSGIATKGHGSPAPIRTGTGQEIHPKPVSSGGGGVVGSIRSR